MKLYVLAQTLSPNTGQYSRSIRGIITQETKTYLMLMHQSIPNMMHTIPDKKNRLHIRDIDIKEWSDFFKHTSNLEECCQEDIKYLYSKLKHMTEIDLLESFLDTTHANPQWSSILDILKKNRKDVIDVLGYNPYV